MTSNVSVVKVWEKSFSKQEDSLYKMFDFYINVLNKKSTFVKTLNQNLRNIGNNDDIFYLSSEFNYDDQSVKVILNKTEIDKS